MSRKIIEMFKTVLLKKPIHMNREPPMARRNVSISHIEFRDIRTSESPSHSTTRAFFAESYFDPLQVTTKI